MNCSGSPARIIPNCSSREVVEKTADSLALEPMQNSIRILRILVLIVGGRVETAAREAETGQQLFSQDTRFALATALIHTIRETTRLRIVC